MSKLDKILESAKKHFESGEEPIVAVMGAYETKILGKDSVRNGVFVATNKRLVFYGPKMFGGYEMEVFPYSNISSIEMGKGLMGHSITFFASGNKATMKWINQGDVQAFIQEVKSRIGKRSDTSSTTLDIPDQIKKLAELKSAGILSDDEFETKKKELLSKM